MFTDVASEGRACALAAVIASAIPCRLKRSVWTLASKSNKKKDKLATLQTTKPTSSSSSGAWPPPATVAVAVLVFALTRSASLDAAHGHRPVSPHSSVIPRGIPSEEPLCSPVSAARPQLRAGSFVQKSMGRCGLVQPPGSCLALDMLLGFVRSTRVAGPSKSGLSTPDPSTLQTHSLTPVHLLETKGFSARAEGQGQRGLTSIHLGGEWAYGMGGQGVNGA